MMLTEQSQVPDAALPLAEFKDHLRLGTGFADDGAQDALLKRLIRAAIAVIEARVGKVLIAKTFLYELSDWRDYGEQALPVAPVSAVLSVNVLDVLGVAILVDPTRYVLVRDMHRPKLAAAGVLFPSVPSDGTVQIVFAAGFGPGWPDVPGDLQQAVLLLAAQYHDHRVEAEAGSMPFGVMALIERWRNVRILGGGVA